MEEEEKKWRILEDDDDYETKVKAGRAGPVGERAREGFFVFVFFCLV